MSACHHTRFQIKTAATSYDCPLFVYITILMISTCHSSTFDATSSSQWLDQTIDCQNGQPCNVTCDMTSSCKRATINCPTADQDHSHTINCVYGLTCLGLSFEPVLFKKQSI
eukprot:201450_1